MPQIVATCSGSIASHGVPPRGTSHCLSRDFIGRNHLALHKLIDLLHVAAVAVAVVALINKSVAAATVA